MYSTKLFRFLVFVGLIFFSYIGYAQPTFVVSNIKGSCNTTKDNGSIELTVTSAIGTVNVFLFGPTNPSFLNVPVGTPILIPNLKGENPANIYLVIVQDSRTSGNNTANTSASIFAYPTTLAGTVDSFVNNTSCTSPNGSINITASGGSGTSYSYSWTGPGGFTASVDDLVNLVGGTYTVVISDNATNCTTTLSQTITDPSPNTFTLSQAAPRVCAGSNLILNLSDSETGVTYHLYRNGTNTGTSVAGTGSPISFTVPAGSYADGDTFTVIATNGFCTPVTMTGSVVVDVAPLPVPTITGNTPLCVGATGEVYTTEPGMTNYAWVVTGGTVTAGGTATSNTVTVNWTTAGSKTITVSYTNADGCTPALPTSYAVTVNPLPVPVISGPVSACINSTTNDYSTAAGMTNYVWTVSAGGTITSGGTTSDNTVRVTWGATGAQTVSVSYTDANNCSPASPTVYNVNVTPLPVPTLTGPATACANSTTSVYTTDPGMTNYVWTVTGGTINTGGTATSNTATVTWGAAGTGTISVNYTNAANCTATTATSLAVTINPQPTPTITGPTSVCVGIPGQVYSTQPGQSNYIWTVVGGNITSGGTPTDNTVTVTWTSSGTQSVSVNYSNSFGCQATAATVYNVTVNPLPAPTITGNAAVCIGSTGNVYTTQTGKTGYVWTVVGGTVTAGGTPTSNTVTVTWTTAGTQSVSVSYADANGCVPAAPVKYDVTVNSKPVPTITGLDPVCANTPGVTYTTEPGMTGYTWLVSAGGTITAGAGTNQITVTWGAAGSRTVRVNYTDTNGCTATASTIKTVTVNARPVVSFTTGPASVCVGQSAIYTTQPGQSNYIWTVVGGTVTSGGTPIDNTVTVTWNTVGSQSVSVNYSNAANCAAATPLTRTVTVNPLPTPTISGPASACLGSTGNIYTTQTGKTAYSWTIVGGTITAGGTPTSSSATVTWNTTGTQSISVNYTDANGCTATVPATYDVTINPAPTPALTGDTDVCAGETGVVYTTDPGKTNYVWVVSAGGSITSGGGAADNTVTVTWNTAGARTVSVNYTDAGCPAASATILDVTVNPLPVPTISGTNTVCIGDSQVYTTQPGMANYVWTVVGGAITSGGTATDNTVTVTWNTAGTQSVKVNYDNASGCDAAADATRSITVNALPTPTISGPNTACQGIAGNVYTTQTGKTNYIWTVVGGTITLGGTSTSSSATVTWGTSGTQTISVSYTDANGCKPASPVDYNVAVTPAPTPALSGDTDVCAGDAGVVYTTDPGKTNYVWSIPAGGTITSGGTATDNTATVTWNTAGTRTIRVNYTDGGCAAASPTVLTVTVNGRPAPTFTAGPSTACIGSTATYRTQAGMTAYVWTVVGGAVTGGGTAADNFVTVTWNTVGTQSVSVNYTNAAGCTAAAAVKQNVTVNPLPVITLNGKSSVCVGETGIVYTTESGKTNYIWTVSPGGTVTLGGGTTNNTVTVTWGTAGAQFVKVTYTDANGCQPATEAVVNVTVNPAPSPTLAGKTPVCVGETGVVYTTESGKANYVWSITGGTITSGGTPTSSTATVTWNTAGPQTISVNYEEAGCAAAAPKILNVNVNALPAPTIIGPTSACIGSTTSKYTTEAGMTNYVWTVSGGTISAGSNTNEITVTWTTAGSQTVTVNYEDAAGCGATTPASYAVTVNPVPVITLSGSASVCVGATGEVYTTDPGMTNYQWTVSGGTITNGGTATDNTVTVTWGTAGPQTVSVNYEDANGCSPALPKSLAVNVNPKPTPVLNGDVTSCIGETGVVYTTDPGKSNYVWVITGGTITNGGSTTDNTATVTWNTAGTQTISVSYDEAGCSPGAPTELDVTVNTRPTVSLTGSIEECQGATGIVYTTDPGMNNYVWTVSGGGTITNGGTATDNTVTVTWSGSGAQKVTVNYDDAITGCGASAAKELNVTVHAAPVPVISGSTAECVGATNVVYTTASGMTNYIWTVSGGGTVTNGGTPTDNTVTVTWGTAGPQTVTVTYTDANGCKPVIPTTLNVAINTVVTPNLSGSVTACLGETGVVYTTDPGKTNYVWTVTGGTITNGGTTTSNTATVTWTTAGTQTISVIYDDASCPAGAPTDLDVTVSPRPTATLTGTGTACVGDTNFIYTTQPGMSNYVWTVTGGTITGGGSPTDNTVTVTWSTAGNQSVQVSYKDANGCAPATPASLPVAVKPVADPSLTGQTAVCAGATGVVYTTENGKTNYVWTVTGGTVTAGGGPNNNTVTVSWPTTGAGSVSVNYTDAAACSNAIPETLAITIGTSPTPALTGTTAVCVSPAVTEVYTTDPGKTNYVWTIVGGTVTAGGANTDNTVTVQWSTAGTGSVSVNYTDGTCAAGAPTKLTVIKSTIPTVTAGPDNLDACGPVTLAGTRPTGTATGVWTIVSGPLDGTFLPSATQYNARFGGTAGVDYVLRWTVTNGACSAFDEVEILFNLNSPTIAYAGPDKRACFPNSAFMDGSIPNTAVGEVGNWTIIPNTATVLPADDPNAEVKGPAGTYTLIWRITNPASPAGCFVNADTATVNIDATAPLVSAGAYPTPFCGSGRLAASDPGTATGLWTIDPGPTGIVIDSVNSYKSPFSGPPGTYNLRWTVTNACGNSTATTTVTIEDGPSPADAGSDDTVCGNTTTLAANQPTIGTGSWSQVATNPPGGVIADPTKYNSDFSGTVGSTYALIWSISKSGCTPNSDTVLIKFTSPVPAVANAGTDQDICGTETDLAATLETDETGQWSIISANAGTGTIGTPVTNPAAHFTGQAGETYVLRWAITKGVSGCTSTDADTVQITFSKDPIQPEAGPDQLNVCGSATMAATPVTIGTGVWSYIALAPTTATGTFTPPNTVDSKFSGQAGASYRLYWTVTNGTCAPKKDSLTVSFDPNSPDVANAGPDQRICGIQAVTLNATPVAANNTGTWTAIIPNDGSIIDPPLTNAGSVFHPAAATTYRLVWTVINNLATPGCGANRDTVVIRIDNAAPTVVDAGPDQTVCFTTTSQVTLAGSDPGMNDGLWTVASGTGGTFANDTLRNTTFTGTSGTTYKLYWTISNGCGAIKDSVNIIFEAPPTTPLAGPDQLNLCGPATMAANEPTVGTGAWSYVALSPTTATGTFTPPDANDSQFKGEPGASYRLYWKITNGTCGFLIDSLDVSFSPDSPTPANAGPDASYCGTAPVKLAANKPGTGETGTWTIIPNDGSTVTLDPADAVPNIATGLFTPVATGTYKLVWNIENTTAPSTCAPNTDTVELRFDVPLPTAIDAGPDQTVCFNPTGSNAVTLAGDQPQAGAHGKWTIVTGTGGTFANDTLYNTTFLGTSGSTYKLYWTISNGCGSRKDSVTIKYETPPAAANAGPDLIRCTAVQVTMAATPATGTWSLVSGPAGPPTPITSPVATFTGVVGQTYTFRWTTTPAAGSVCPATSDDIVVNYAAPPTVSAAPSTTICVNDAAPTLTAVAAGVTLFNWYTVDPTLPAPGLVFRATTGGSYTPAAELDRTTAGTLQYVVKAQYPCGESNGTAITITVSNTGGCGVPANNCNRYRLSSMIVQRPTCDGPQNGRISFKVEHAVLPAPPGSIVVSLVKKYEIPSKQIVRSIPVLEGEVVDFPGLDTAKTYTIRLVDGNNVICELDQEFGLKTIVTASASDFVNAICPGEATGQARITASGGSSPYEYSINGVDWIPGLISGNIISGLPANGRYNITVRDDASDACPDTVTLTINSPAPITHAIANLTPVTDCNGADGAFTVSNIQGGSGTYNIRLLTQNATGGLTVVRDFEPVTGGSMEYTDLPQGSYIIVIEDGNGCTVNTSGAPTVIDAPGAIDFTVTKNGDATCTNGANSGSIKINFAASGSYLVGIGKSQTIEPARYQLVNFVVGDPPIGVDTLAAGRYFVFAKPATGTVCPSVRTITGGDGSGAIGGVIAVSFGTQRVCNTNGAAALNITNIKGDSTDVNATVTIKVFRDGDDVNPVEVITMPNLLNEKSMQLVYNPSGSPSHDFLTQPDKYYIELSQKQGTCTITTRNRKLYRVISSMTILVDNIRASLPEPRQTGGFTLKDIVGGFPSGSGAETPFYNVSIIDPEVDNVIVGPLEVPRNAQGVYEYDFTNMAIGTYRIMVTDSSGCEADTLVTVPPDTRIIIPNVFTPNNDDVNDTFEIVNLPVNGKHKLVVTNRWGSEVFTSSDYRVGTFWNAEGATEGIYFYRLKVEGGQTYTGWVEIIIGTKP